MKRQKKIQELYDIIKEMNFKHFKQSIIKFKSMNLHPGQLMLLNHIPENGIKQSELVKMTGRERATITIALQRLEKNDYIKKERIDDKIAVFLTEKGKETGIQFEKMHQEELETFANILTDEELDQLIHIVYKIKKELYKEN